MTEDPHTPYGADDFAPLREAPFSEALSRMETLLSEGKRTFLFGAGCSKCANLPLTTDLTERVLSSTSLDATAKSILKAIRQRFDGAEDSNIEDYLSELTDLLAISTRRSEKRASQVTIQLDDSPYSAEDLLSAIEQIKQEIVDVVSAKAPIDTHRDFIRAIHREHRPGSTSAASAVDYLVLNYDCLIENSLGMERIPYADGMEGGASAWWDPTTFAREGVSARVIKLHGSIDWVAVENDPRPRRIASTTVVDATGNRRIVIWPASTKYREAQLDPFAQLMNQAREVLSPQSKHQHVLLICGYRFADSHINSELDNALRDPENNLTVLAFTPSDRPEGQLKAWLEDTGVASQVLVFARRGFFFGNEEHVSGEDLLWWKFENLTRLIGGER